MAALGKDDEEENWRAVRGRIWLDYCFFISKATPYHFSVDYLADEFAISKLVYKWMKGKSSPTRSSALRVAGSPTTGSKKHGKSIPESLWLFDALSMLSPDLRSAVRITSLINLKLKREKTGEWGWSFPETSISQSHASDRYDIQSLKARADMWGLLAIICLMREAELKHQYKAHVELYTAAHSVLSRGLQSPWGSPHIDNVKSLLAPLGRRALLTSGNLDDDGTEATRQEIKTPPRFYGWFPFNR